MEIADLLRIAGDEPVFETGLLLAGGVDARDVRRQLSRWTRAGHVLQLRRGVYALAPPYCRLKPHPFVIANSLVRGSYVSLQAALAHYSLIPEATPLTTSVATDRPRRWDTPLGSFDFRHVRLPWFHGYRRLELGAGQHAFVATPEKALLDLVYLQPGGDTPAYLDALRLQGLDQLNLDHLVLLAEASGSPKLQRAAQAISTLSRAEGQEYEAL
jgi:predicted transcriptional regulator of viral defense system